MMIKGLNLKRNFLLSSRVLFDWSSSKTTLMEKISVNF